MFWLLKVMHSNFRDLVLLCFHKQFQYAVCVYTPLVNMVSPRQVSCKQKVLGTYVETADWVLENGGV